MTTAAAAALYELQHLRQWHGQPVAVFNPHNKPFNELPVIFGFNNGGGRDWWEGALVAEDGTPLGGHVCSSESYMPHDLGVLEGSRPDRHETFQKHYPDGYRMEFVGYGKVKTHTGLMAAIENAKQATESAPEPFQENVELK